MGKNARFWTILVVALLALTAIGFWAVGRPSGPRNQGTQQNTGSGTTTDESTQEGAKVVKVTAPTQAEIDAAKKAGTIPVTIETAKGNIEVELRGELTPLTVANFTKLAKAGFYDGLSFHRVEDWVIQGGDPSGNGTGGPGYAIKLETSPALKNVRGAIAMARSSDPNSAGSQFYILKTDASWLDGQYAVFGKVKSGMDVVDKIQIGDAINKVTVGK